MNRSVSVIALLVTASLLVTPAVVADENDDIPTNAQNTGVHDSLVDALVHADLVSTLQGDGPFTVFAPTDAAFADAGIDLSTFDTDEENATLVDILTYHVYSGSVAAADVTDGMSATMVNGDSVTFTVTDGTVMVGDATVTTADVMASNGIIHVIDKVLMPPADAPDTTDCAAIIGIDASGLAYDQTDISVDVGDTVCWIWSDESMGHNVAETGGPSDNYRKMSGVYSGAVAETVDFRHTFTEDETFYYMCEPHVSMDMRGKITVGNGTPPAAPAPDDEPSNTVPGFGILAVALSAFAALILIRVETLRMIRPIAPRIPREV